MKNHEWDEHHMTTRIERIFQILRVGRTHRFGQPFLSAYQIATEFAQQEENEDVIRALGLPVGGLGTGQYKSLAKSIATQLRQRISSGNIDNIEGVFLHRKHVRKIIFKDNQNQEVEASLDSNYALSMFRLRE